MLDVLIFAAFVMSQPSYQVIQRFLEPIVILAANGLNGPSSDSHCLSTMSLNDQLGVYDSDINLAPFRQTFSFYCTLGRPRRAIKRDASQ